MMNEYKTVKLGNVLNIQSSSRIFEREYVSEGIPFYRSKEIIEKHKGNDVSTSLFISEERFNKIKQAYSVPRDGDILLTSVGTIGIPYLVRENERFYFKDGNLTWFNNFSDRIDNEYFYYWLLSEVGKEALNSILIGTTQKALTIKDLKTLEISLPPLSSQHRISNILSSFDNKIELLRKENNTLEDIAQSIFKEWFVKYNFPNKDGKPYRDNNGKMIDSELGLIPEGWRVSTIGETYKLIAGGDKPKHFSEKKTAELCVPIYSNGIKDDGLYGYTDKPQINVESVTVSARGTIGFIKLRTEPYLPIVRLIAVIPKNKNLSSKYVYYYLTNQNIQGNGTTQQQLTIPAFSTMTIPVPGDTIVNNFTKLSNSIHIKIVKNTREIRDLFSAREKLLTELISIS